MLSPGEAVCRSCTLPEDAAGEVYTKGRLSGGMIERPGKFRREHDSSCRYYGPGLIGLVGRSVEALVADSGSSPNARLRALRHIAIGFFVLVAWVGIVAGLGYLLFDVLQIGRAPAGAPRPGRVEMPWGFGWILFFSIWPAAWSTLKIVFGLFQAITGMPFVEFHDWYERLPLWLILLLTPIMIVVVVVLVVGLLVGTLALCGFLFRLVAG
jgi:hypothetical protein